MRQPIGRLHVITDSLDVAIAALDAGAPVIQVRAKDATDATLYDLTCRVLEHAAPLQRCGARQRSCARRGRRGRAGCARGRA